MFYGRCVDIIFYGRWKTVNLWRFLVLIRILISKKIRLLFLTPKLKV